MRITTLFPMLLLPSLALALQTQIRLVVPVSVALPNPELLPPTTTASLTTLSSTLTAFLDTSNSFSFRNVTPGSYLVDVHCATHVFAPLRIDVADDGKVMAWDTFRGNEWSNKGEQRSVSEGNGGAKILEVKVQGGKKYYAPRGGYSPLSILSNPMIIMAGVGMLVVFGMPKILENLDPETLAEMEERQKSSAVHGILSNSITPGASPLQDFDAAGWLAGSGKKGEAPEKGVSR